MHPADECAVLMHLAGSIKINHLPGSGNVRNNFPVRKASAAEGQGVTSILGENHGIQGQQGFRSGASVGLHVAHRWLVSSLSQPTCHFASTCFAIFGSFGSADVCATRKRLGCEHEPLGGKDWGWQIGVVCVCAGLRFRHRSSEGVKSLDFVLTHAVFSR